MATSIIASVIWLLHLGLILFMIIVPFLPDPSWALLLLHSVVGASLLLHWHLNDDTCAFTYLEAYVRGVPVQSSFLHQLVSPVYLFASDKDCDIFVNIATWFLILVSSVRLGFQVGALPHAPY